MNRDEMMKRSGRDLLPASNSHMAWIQRRGVSLREKAKLLRENGLTLDEVADRLGVTPEWLNQAVKP